jgi:hypothetical protein
VTDGVAVEYNRTMMYYKGNPKFRVCYRSHEGRPELTITNHGYHLPMKIKLGKYITWIIEELHE